MVVLRDRCGYELGRFISLIDAIMLAGLNTRYVLIAVILSVVFFFQAEDGIRDDLVTGVQTCALPISGLISVYGEPLGFALGPDGTRQRLPRARIHAVRSHIGMVFQQFNLWPHMTALGNVSEALNTLRRLPVHEAADRPRAHIAEDSAV